jgi:hypothetical protein
MAPKSDLPARRRAYARPTVTSERYAERRAMACPKHLDTNTPKGHCVSGIGYNS